MFPALEYPISALDRFVLHDATWRRDSSVASADDVGPMDPRVPEERTRKVAAEAREANRELEAIRATLSWRITRPLRAVRELQGRLGSRGSGTETAGRGRPEPAEDNVETRASADELAPAVRACSERVLQIADLLDGREVRLPRRSTQTFRSMMRSGAWNTRSKVPRLLSKRRRGSPSLQRTGSTRRMRWSRQ